MPACHRLVTRVEEHIAPSKEFGSIHAWASLVRVIIRILSQQRDAASGCLTVSIPSPLDVGMQTVTAFTARSAIHPASISYPGQALQPSMPNDGSEIVIPTIHR